jgi:hypothetical protein
LQRLNENVLPLSTSLRSQMRPPCSSTMRFVSASPSQFPAAAAYKELSTCSKAPKTRSDAPVRCRCPYPARRLPNCGCGHCRRVVAGALPCRVVFFDLRRPEILLSRMPASRRYCGREPPSGVNFTAFDSKLS